MLIETPQLWRAYISPQAAEKFRAALAVALAAVILPRAARQDFCPGTLLLLRTSKKANRS